MKPQIYAAPAVKGLKTRGASNAQSQYVCSTKTICVVECIGLRALTCKWRHLTGVRYSLISTL